MEPVVIAEGLEFPEGPVLEPDGSMVCALMRGEALARVSPDGTVERFGALGGGPNGTARGADGTLYVANNGGLSADPSGFWHAEHTFDGRVQSVSPTGVVTTVADDLPGEQPHRPNDICFGPDGRLYFTDSANWEDMRNIRPGHVLATSPDGGDVEALAELAALPNGLAFGPGDTSLFVVQTLTRRIFSYPWSPDGLGDPEEFVRLPEGMPDGLCFDADGNLYICGSLGNVIYGFNPTGEQILEIRTPDGSQPTNCCLGDGRLYVTFSLAGQLVAYDIDAKPLPLHDGS